MTAAPGTASFLGTKPPRFYCRKPPAEYHIAPETGVIFQPSPPGLADRAAYIDEQFDDGVYGEYAAAADLKYRTFEARMRAIEPLAPGRRLLDVGCSCGFFLETALRHGFDPYGIEFSAKAIGAAAESVRPRITLGDAEQLLSRAEEPYDVVAAFDILEHMRDPLAFVTTLRRLLRPGGLLVLTTPDTDHILRRIMGCRWPMLQAYQHLFLFSRRAMRLLLEEAGFAEIRLSAARKTITLDYVMGQIRVHNPLASRLYRAAAPLVPKGLRARPFSINLGEMQALACRAGDASGH